MQTANIQPLMSTVLVVGAHGFLGGFIVAALRAAGYHAVRGIRIDGRALGDDERACDLSRMLRPEDWRDALIGVDAVVNVAGVLRERGAQTFDAIHVYAPLALARACVDVGVSRFVQISALGRPEDGAFIASKHRFDDALLALPLEAVVLRPSVVYATTGSYGGTSLLRALAALPVVQWLPGDGAWPIQPLAADDLATLVVRALEAPRGCYEVGGPQVMTLRDYQHEWRHWLRIGGERVIHVPEALVSAQVTLFDIIGRGPIGKTMWRMLKRGNTTAPDAWTRLQQTFEFAPRELSEVLAARPSQVQDRWHAQLYFLAPMLRIALVLLWLLSGWSGLATPSAQIEQVFGDSWLAALAPVTMACAAGVLDLVLGLWLASGWKSRIALSLMALSVLAYTIAFGVAIPGAWLDPLGGLAKNLVVLPALAVAWVLADRR
jgi:uncharacterized protein YbjT (DUF2867 family)/uncharacterized membrane protein YphA (DoxX/SURF4 family)